MVRTPPLTIDPRALHIQRPPDEAEDRIVHRKSLLRVCILPTFVIIFRLSSFIFRHLPSYLSTFLVAILVAILVSLTTMNRFPDLSHVTDTSIKATIERARSYHERARTLDPLVYGEDEHLPSTEQLKVSHVGALDRP